MVYPEHEYGGPRDGRLTDEDRTLPCEMLGPAILARVKQSHELAGARIQAGDVRAFVAVAVVAGEREVRGDRLAAVLLGDDVIDLKRSFGVCVGQEAVFATECARAQTCSSRVRSTELYAAVSPAFLSERRAFAFIKSSSLQAWR
jgi:hypothetical protein